MTLLSVAGASRDFGAGPLRRTALHPCSVDADAGEIVGVVGPNGAGKTTLLGMIAGDVALTGGSIRIGGHRAGSRRARRLVGFAPEPPSIPGFLTGRQWLAHLAQHRSATAGEGRTLVRSAIELGELHDVCDRRVATYSRGMCQRLALGGAVLLGERVVLLDETLSGIDPLVLRRLRRRLAAMAAGGRLVIVASHDLAAIERVATRVLVLAGGRVRADVATARLAAERVAELTLSGGSLAGAARILARYRGAVRTGYGVAVPLAGGISVEQVLATCRQDRIAVTASRVRYRVLEDLLVAAVGAEEQVA